MTHHTRSAKPRPKRGSIHTPEHSEASAARASDVLDNVSDTVIEAMSDAVGIYDADGLLLRYNNAFQRLLGLHVEPDHSTLSIAERTERLCPRHPDGRLLGAEENGIARLLRGETIEPTSPLELRVTTYDGRDVLVRLSGAPLRERNATGNATGSEPGRIVGAVATMRDISERRHLDEQLYLLTSMLDRSHDPVFLWRLDGPIVYWNQGAARLYGYSSAEAIGQNAHDLLRTRLPEPAAQFDAHLARTGEWTGELTHTTRVGREIDVLGSLQVLPGQGAAGDSVPYVFETAQDITERKRLERRTRQALAALLAMAHALVERPAAEPGASGEEFAGTRALAHRLAELTRDVLGCRRVGLVTINPETREQKALAVVGLAPDLERQWWDEQTYIPRYGEGADPELLARFEAGEAIPLDMSQPPFDTQPNLYGITTSLFVPLRIGGKVVGILSLDHGGERHEFTESERVLSSAVGQLAALVIERDRLFQERAEAQASALAEREANRRTDQFLGIVNHELKNPVAAIATTLELLARRLVRLRMDVEVLLGDASPGEGLPPALARQFETADSLVGRGQTSTKRLTRMVDDLLDVSRIRAGKFELLLETCDLAQVVRDAVEEQRQLHPNRTLALASAQDAPVWVRADPIRLGQVITNYLTNALKYSSESQPVHVTLRNDADSAQVLVRDHGQGLSESHLEHIWNAFYRADGVDVLSGNGVGLGLGLHICQIIIRLHGGQVGVESTPGVGSTFWFSLPVVSA